MNSETTCGLKNSYIEAYLGEKEAKRCIRQWSKLEKRHWLSFNPAAWLFSFLWLFHKKMHREFAVFLAAFLILPVIVGGIAGISKMEGEITPKAVYLELRRIPITIDDIQSACVYGQYSKYLKMTVPWYILMISPALDPDSYYFRINSEPAFYYGLFRVMTMLALNIFLGVYGNRLYFRSVRGRILRQFADMSTDEENSRLRILEKSGRENAFKIQQMKLAPLFALVCVILPFFYDAICIIY
ncbi:MAG: DUF2628 domain-containing protein [Oscillospiraceae bacterium]|nr:DUF2628 domain-containing protein [Oscillospiraceae bacterium]